VLEGISQVEEQHKIGEHDMCNGGGGGVMGSMPEGTQVFKGGQAVTGREKQGLGAFVNSIANQRTQAGKKLRSKGFGFNNTMKRMGGTGGVNTSSAPVNSIAPQPASSPSAGASGGSGGGARMMANRPSRGTRQNRRMQ
jgi:hypothetical protein